MNLREKSWNCSKNIINWFLIVKTAISSLNGHIFMYWPCIYRVRRVCPLYSRCQIPTFIWELLPEMLCNLGSGCNPNAFLRRNVFHNLLQCLKTTWLADAATMCCDCHHLRCALTSLFIERIEGALDVVEKVRRGPKSCGYVELVIVTI